MKHQRILVCGGGGFIGRYVVDRLVARGVGVVVPTRRRDRIKSLIVLPTVEVIDADVHDPSTLGRLIAGCDAVINLIGILHGNYPPSASLSYGSDFLQVHVELPRRIVSACERRGVRRLLQVSALGADPSGHPRPVRGLPDGASRLMAGVFEHLPGEPAMSRDNLDSLKVDSVASRQPYWPAPELQIRPTPMEPEAMLYLAGLHPRTRYGGLITRSPRRDPRVPRGVPGLPTPRPACSVTRSDGGVPAERMGAS